MSNILPLSTSTACAHDNSEYISNFQRPETNDPNIQIDSLAGKPVSFWDFFQKLDDVKWCSSPTLNKERRIDGREYNTGKALYQEGVDKLLKATFISLSDAMNSLKAVLSRAFRELSVESKVSKSSYKPQRIKCTKAKCSKEVEDTEAKESTGQCRTKRGLHRLGLCFGEDKERFNDKCKWNAYIVRADNGFYFSSISSLTDHAVSCFTGFGYKHRELLKLVSGCDSYMNRLLMNTVIFSKIGYAVNSEDVTKHKYGKRITATVQEIQELKKQVDTSILKEHKLSLPEDLTDEDKATIGALCSFCKDYPGFNFRYTVSGGRIDFLVCLWPSQIEKLEHYGDLIFIDSTFGVSARGYKALNVVVVDQHFKSVLAATAFACCEKVLAYKQLLGFIMESVKYKRLPLCLISDAAPQIHASVAEVYPYCRHIHCAFHLCKDEVSFGKGKKSSTDDKSSASSTKQDVRDNVLTLFTTSSQSKFDCAVSKLLRALEDQ